MRFAKILALLFFSAGIVAAEPSAYSGKASELELPEISAIVDIQYVLTDMENDNNDNKLRINEAELAFQGYLSPSVRGDFIIALEQEYGEDGEVETELDVEEAYASFLDLPADLQADVGRKLLGFGRLNSEHPHHWSFVDTPLAMENIFGHHPWLDDGGELTCLIPNPADLYLKISAGAWNGKQVGHAHSHLTDEETGEHSHGETINWDDHVFTGRLFTDFPVSERINAQAGYSYAVDEGDTTELQGADFVLKYQWPQTYRRLKWHNECFLTDDNERNTEPFGLFSILQYTINKYWELGGRYDWTELLEDDTQDAWAGTGFLSYYLTHTTYIRGQYQFKEHADGDEENIISTQLVWGIGPHSHRLSD